MSVERIIRRLQDQTRNEDAPRETGPAEPESESVGMTFLPRYLREGKEPLPPQTREPVGAQSADTPTDFESVGEHVATVLAAAEAAAERIREEAERVADGIRAEAESDAKRVHGEAAALRQEAERFHWQAEKDAAEKRAAVDSYADEKRSEAETEAEKIKARAEGEGRATVKAAERRAQELEQAAQRRIDELAGEAAKIEERLAAFLGATKALGETLEEVLDSREEYVLDAESLEDALLDETR
jgi:cell division septum initiation protein DivIVA